MPAAGVYSLMIKKENAHEDPIYSCVWAQTNTTGDAKGPYKNFIVTGGLDTEVKIWQLENNKLDVFHTLNGHSMAVMSISVSPDGHTLATTSLDSTLIIWDMTSGNKVHEIQSGPTDVWNVTFSPDGTQVASGSHSGKIFIYGVIKGTVDGVLDTRGKFAVSVAWSMDNKYICCGAVDGTLCIFDVAQGKLVHTVEAHTQTIRSVAFSPNSQLIATASHDGDVKVYNVAGANLQSALNFKMWVLRVCFSNDGSRIAVATGDGSVHIVAVDKMTILKTFKEHTKTVWDVQFNATSDKLVTVSKDKCINVYECPIPPKNTTKK